MSNVKHTDVSMHLVDGGDEKTGEVGKDQNKKITYAELYNLFKISPEMVGITSAICDDLMGEQFEWSGSKSAIANAKKFGMRNHFRKKLYSALQDYALTGDGYLGISLLSSLKLKTIISEMHKGVNSSSVMEKLKVRRPDIFQPREVFPLKTTTIKIDYDEHGVVLGYAQKVPGNSKTIYFEPSEVIHLSLNNLGHDVYGTSPFWSCLNEIASLWHAKDYAGMFFQNDGVPDWIFIMKDESPNSTNVKKFKKTLNQFKRAKNKHKSLLLTGEVEVKQLNNFDKDLEFSQLLDKFTQRLLMAWNMPPTRMSNMEGNYRASIEGNEGYYKKINRLQAEIEETLNTELWSQFGNCEMHFPRVYKRDESREADIITKLVGKPVMTQNEGREYIGKKPMTDEPGLDEIPKKEVPIQGPQQEDKNTDETGNQHQTAAEKVSKSKTDLVIENFNHFISVVEANPAELPFWQTKRYYNETTTAYTFYYADGHWKYECAIPKKDIGRYAKDEEDFKFRFVTGAIPIVNRVGRPNKA